MLLLLLAAGRWPLAAGRWLLAAGCWLLAVDGTGGGIPGSGLPRPPPFVGNLIKQDPKKQCYKNDSTYLTKLSF
jgi:hypothetical protein